MVLHARRNQGSAEPWVLLSAVGLGHRPGRTCMLGKYSLRISSYFEVLIYSCYALLVFGSTAHCQQRSSSKPLSQQIEESVIASVRQRSGVPGDVTLVAIEESVITGGYRSIRVSSASPNFPFETRVFLSPDKGSLVPSVYPLDFSYEEVRRIRGAGEISDLLRGKPNILGEPGCPSNGGNIL